jgi:hypothetical protein
VYGQPCREWTESFSILDHRYAILVDGGFFTRKLYVKLGRRTPEVDDVVAEIDRIRQNPVFAGY